MTAQDVIVDRIALRTPLAPQYGGVPSNGILFMTDAACPDGYAVYTALRGRYVVGLPQNGTLAGTSGTALNNLQVRRGGTAHAGPSLSAISVSDDFSVSYTRPSVSYTRPSVNHQHTHTYHRERVVTGATGTRLGQGSARLLGDNPQTGGISAGPTVSGGGVSISGGAASISGGGVSLAGDVSLSGGTISGGGANNQPQPAPYIQLLACQRS